MNLKLESPKGHFSHRAERFNISARWVRDQNLLNKIFLMSGVKSSDVALDVATGTGQVAKRFYQRVKTLYGVDISQEMGMQNKFVDQLIYTSAEKMPFQDEMFDLVVCRQGLQFMDIALALNEIKRVLKPNGRLVLAHLTSYSESDREETFRTMELRNAARRNFFTPDDLPRMLIEVGFSPIDSFHYPCRETVLDWLSHGAMKAERVERAMKVYQHSTETFKELHKVSIEDTKIDETMNMQIINALKLRT